MNVDKPIFCVRCGRLLDEDMEGWDDSVSELKYTEDGRPVCISCQKKIVKEKDDPCNYCNYRGICEAKEYGDTDCIISDKPDRGP